MDKILTNIATLGKIGYSRFMPGTMGAFIGTLFAYLLFKFCACLTILIISGGLVLFAIYACSVAECVIGTKDPSCVILDEFAAMPLCFLFLKRGSIVAFLIGFLIFRLFDILKPWGIRKCERFRSGMGIVLDDALAACYTNITLHVLLYLIRNCVKADF
ncbi:MAG: phosphatidylglycerophosphatase A [Puniceicoccales bacterium]|jgi:phosphatidylglycerophosphatase A|nr:phosphatidylglycerophosphatase A [Puniceicoccales bacterium]